MIHAIDNFFTSLLSGIGEKFSLSSLTLILTGIFIGIIITSAIYGIGVLLSIRDDKLFKNKVKEENNIDEDHIHELVEEIKNNFKDQIDGLTIGEKLGVMGQTVYDTMNAVANEYYKDSKYPLYEVTVEEFILFLNYLSSRIDSIFSKKILKSLRKVSISKIFELIDTKKQIDQNKVVKAANKMKVGKISSVLFSIINYANPIYWVKKVVLNTTYGIVFTKAACAIIDIVADETNKTYSKSIFEREKSIQKEEIEKALLEMESLNENIE